MAKYCKGCGNYLGESYSGSDLCDACRSEKESDRQREHDLKLTNRQRDDQIREEKFREKHEKELLAEANEEEQKRYIQRMITEIAMAMVDNVEKGTQKLRIFSKTHEFQEHRLFSEAAIKEQSEIYEVYKNMIIQSLIAGFKSRERSLQDANDAPNILIEETLNFYYNTNPEIYEHIVQDSQVKANKGLAKLVQSHQEECVAIAAQENSPLVEESEAPAVERDERFEEAARLIVSMGQGSTSLSSTENGNRLCACWQDHGRAATGGHNWTCGR